MTRYTPPGQQDAHAAENLELRQKVEELQRKLDGQAPHAAQMWHPSALTIWLIVLGVTALLGVAFFAGYMPLKKRDALVRSETSEQAQALPRAEVITVGRALGKSGLQLPGSIQAIT